MSEFWLIRHGESDSNAGLPTGATEVPLATSLEQAQVGGLGIRFIRAAAAHITHERVADKNRTTVWLNR